MRAAAIPTIESAKERMLTYTLADEKGAKIILSIRAGISDDVLIRAALEMLAVPPHPDRIVL